MEQTEGSSNKGFGQVFAVVFLIIALWPLTGDGSVRLWSLAVAAVFLGLAYFWPAPLTPLNKLWTRFGLLLHRIINPIIMGVLYFVCVTPFGVVRRLITRDPLGVKYDPEADSYWKARTPRERDHMKYQF